jgi:predicted CXXCH cytochrome family protein
MRRKYLALGLGVGLLACLMLVGLKAGLPVQADPLTPHGGYSFTTDACARCHSTHTAQGPSLLKTNESNAGCLACHDGTGAYSIVSTHSNEDFPNAVEEPFTLECVTCHDPHGDSPNLSLVKDEINDFQVLFLSRSGPDSFDEDSGDDTDTDDICVTCHINPASNAGYPTIDHPGGNGHAGDTPDLRNGACTNCHMHDLDGFPLTKDGFMSDCAGCHAFPPDGSTAPNTAGAHGTHDSGSHGFAVKDCRGCHTVVTHNGIVSFESTITDIATTAACDDCHSPGGTFNGVVSTAGSVGAKDNWLGGVYNETALQTGKDNWCFGCHDEEPAVIEGATAPNIYPTFTGNETGTSPSGANLNSHHDVLDADQAYSGAVIECTDCHAGTTLISDPDPGDGRVPVPGNSWATSSLTSEICLDCHDSSYPTTITPPIAPLTDILVAWTQGNRPDQHGLEDSSMNVSLREGSGYSHADVLQCTDCHNAGHGDNVGGTIYTNLYNLKAVVLSKDGLTPLLPDQSIPGEDPYIVRITDSSNSNEDPLTNGTVWCSTCHPQPMGGNKTKGCIAGNCHTHGSSSF